MKKNRLKFLALGLAAALSVGVTAGCGGGGQGGGQGGSGSSSSMTQISFRQFGGTVASTDWLKQAADRFSKANADKSYESGKKGVKVVISTNKDGDYKSSIPDYDIILDENTANIYDMQSRGFIANIDDLVKELESKIEPQLLPKLKGADGKYYGLPHYSYDVGISYNKDMFKEYNLYIADPSETNVATYNSSLTGKTMKFCMNESAKKSCGPDGIYNSYDDGLPSSLEEYVGLCDYIKKQKGIYPFALCALVDGANYAFMLIEAIWSGRNGRYESDYL